MGLKEEWLENLNNAGLKYFVLKAEDFFATLSEEEVRSFDNFLVKHEQFRIDSGKHPCNKYWIVNRDEPYADEVKKIIEDNEGIEL